jgi:hypothetical protein
MKWKNKKDTTLIIITHEKMVLTRVLGQDMKKPREVLTDYNSGMGGVDLSDAYLKSYHTTRKRHKKKYCQKHFHHLIDNCYLNSCLFTKKKKRVAEFPGWNFK